MQTIDMEQLQDKSSEITNTYSYPGSDAPPDDKPYKPHGFWKSLTTVVESVSWQLLYATNGVIGYKLLLSLQEDSLTPQPFLWVPVVTTVVVGWLSRSHWNPELPVFNQLDEQESNQQYELQTITLTNCPNGGSSTSSATSSGNAGTSSSNPKRAPTFSFHSVATWFTDSTGSNEGDAPPPEPLHTRSETICCPTCNGPCELRPREKAQDVPDPQDQPLFSVTQRLPAPDGTVTCRINIRPQTDGQGYNSHSVNMGSVTSGITTQEADSTTQTQGNPPPVNSHEQLIPTDKNGDTVREISIAKRKKSSSAVETHETKAKQTKKSYCSYQDCPYAANGPSNLAIHEQKHLPKEERTYKYHCDHPDCTYKFHYSSQLTVHQKTHLPKEVRTYDYHCIHPGCGYETNYRWNLDRHGQTHQPDRDKEQTDNSPSNPS